MRTEKWGQIQSVLVIVGCRAVGAIEVLLTDKWPRPFSALKYVLVSVERLGGLEGTDHLRDFCTSMVL